MGKLVLDVEKINLFLNLDRNELLVEDFWDGKVSSERIPLGNILWNGEEFSFSFYLKRHAKLVRLYISKEGEIRGSKSTVSGGNWIEVIFHKNKGDKKGL